MVFRIGVGEERLAADQTIVFCHGAERAPVRQMWHSLFHGFFYGR